MGIVAHASEHAQSLSAQHFTGCSR